MPPARDPFTLEPSVARSRIITALLTLLLGTMGAVAYVRWTGSPEYSLRELGRAYAAHDRLGVEAYLDADAVARSVVDEMIGGIFDRSSARQSGGYGALGSTLAARMAEGMRPSLEGDIRKSIVDAVAGTNRSVAVEAIERITADDVLVTSRRDTLALAQVWIPRADGGSASLLTLRLVHRGSPWTIVAVEGAKDFLESERGGGTSTRASVLLKANLRNLAAAQESYYADYTMYAGSLQEIQQRQDATGAHYFTLDSGITMEVTARDTTWSARAVDRAGTTTCTMSANTGRTDDGVPRC